MPSYGHFYWRLHLHGTYTPPPRIRLNSARLEARSTYGEVVDYLRWNSKYGGVYVEEPIKTQLDKAKINPKKENVVITTSKEQT